MKKENLLIKENKCLNKDIYMMTFSGDFTSITNPGQFIDIEVPGFYLRRPISIYSWTDTELTIIFKVLGNGTDVMSRMQKGESLNCIYPLGNGFDVSTCTNKTLLVGGGIGVPPLFGLAKELIKKGIKPQLVMGFTNETDIILIDEFRSIGIEPIITTVDGSVGTKGFVTTVMKDLDYDYTCSCGPIPMLKAVYNECEHGEFSFEARMGCGFGACMGCSMKTNSGNKRICKDGPVFTREDIIW